MTNISISVSAHFAIQYLEDHVRLRAVQLLEPDPIRQAIIANIIGPTKPRFPLAIPQPELFEEVDWEPRPPSMKAGEPPLKDESLTFRVPKADSRHFRWEVEELQKLVGRGKLSAIMNSQDWARKVDKRVRTSGIDLPVIEPSPRMSASNRKMLQEIRDCMGNAVDLVETADFIRAIKMAAALINGLFPHFAARIEARTVEHSRTLEKRLSQCRVTSSSRNSDNPQKTKPRKSSTRKRRSMAY